MVVGGKSSLPLDSNGFALRMWHAELTRHGKVIEATV